MAASKLERGRKAEAAIQKLETGNTSASFKVLLSSFQGKRGKDHLGSLWHSTFGPGTMTEPRKSRLAAAREFFADPSIPDKLYFRMGEVSKLTETKAYVLRYWETEFPSLRPVRRSGHRLYRRRDVETIFRIKRLLYQQGFTIEGARRHILSENSKKRVEQKPLFSSGADASRGKAMQAIRRELEGILTILSRQC